MIPVYNKFNLQLCNEFLTVAILTSFIFKVLFQLIKELFWSLRRLFIPILFVFTSQICTHHFTMKHLSSLGKYFLFFIQFNIIIFNRERIKRVLFIIPHHSAVGDRNDYNKFNAFGRRFSPIEQHNLL